MSDGIKIESKLPAELINGVIQAEIVKALSNKDELITAIVKAAMLEPVDRYRGSPLKIEVAVKNAIQEAADEAIQEWVQQVRPEIKAALFKELNRGKQKRLKQMVDSLMANISNYYGISINANLLKLECD